MILSVIAYKYTCVTLWIELSLLMIVTCCATGTGKCTSCSVESFFDLLRFAACYLTLTDLIIWCSGLSGSMIRR